MTQSVFAKLALIVLFALGLAACGRAGAPELPPSATTTVDGEQVEEPQQEDRRFVLDPLLN